MNSASAATTTIEPVVLPNDQDASGRTLGEREIELVAVRTADVRPGPTLDLPAGEPLRATGPTVLELDGATCWVPPGWVGARDGPTLVLTKP